jgi:hypothetical protein
MDQRRDDRSLLVVGKLDGLAEVGLAEDVDLVHVARVSLGHGAILSGSEAPTENCLSPRQNHRGERQTPCIPW